MAFCRQTANTYFICGWIAWVNGNIAVEYACRAIERKTAGTPEKCPGDKCNGANSPKKRQRTGPAYALLLAMLLHGHPNRGCSRHLPALPYPTQLQASFLFLLF